MLGGELIGYIEHYWGSAFRHDSPSQVFLVAGGEIVVPEEVGRILEIGVHALTAPLHPQRVDIGFQPGKLVAGLGGKGKVLAEVVGSRWGESGQGSDELS